MKLIRSRTPHPCAGMTAAQRRDFERIAFNEAPLGGARTIERLKARGLIVETYEYQDSVDEFGPVRLKRRVWYLPASVRDHWCKWCSEHSKFMGELKMRIPRGTDIKIETHESGVEIHITGVVATKEQAHELISCIKQLSGALGGPGPKPRTARAAE